MSLESIGIWTSLTTTTIVKKNNFDFLTIRCLDVIVAITVVVAAAVKVLDASHAPQPVEPQRQHPAHQRKQPRQKYLVPHVLVLAQPLLGRLVCLELRRAQRRRRCGWAVVAVVGMAGDVEHILVRHDRRRIHKEQVQSDAQPHERHGPHGKIDQRRSVALAVVCVACIVDRAKANVHHRGHKEHQRRKDVCP